MKNIWKYLLSTFYDSFVVAKVQADMNSILNYRLRHHIHNQSSF